MKAMVTCLALWFTVFLTNASGGKVYLITVNGAIGPATAGYISRSVDEAESRGAQCLVIELNTPGGLLESTKVIVQKLLASSVPVVVYVAPIGASATSAGCFITVAASVAAMAPATTIGAAHPVMMGGNIPDGDGQKPDNTMKQKLENFAVSYIEAIAAKRHRNVDWAKSAVRESASIPADKALELKVIEIIAKDLPDLLQKLDGRIVEDKELRTAGAEVVEIPMSANERVFQLLWRPEVMFVLMLVAIYGIIGELSSPGAILPGVVGAIALVLVLYMAAILPINISGLILIGLAFVLFALDIFAPSHGALTVGGIIAFLLGSLMLFNRDDPLFRLSLAYIIPATIGTALFFAFIVGKGLRAQSLPIRAGKETLLGKTVPASTPINSTGGKVFIEGEQWNAVSDTPIERGQPVEVAAVQGLTLKVKPGSTDTCNH